MNDDLPRRPFSELSPPPNGLAQVRRDAGRRRRRKAWTSASGAVAVVAASSAFVLASSSDHSQGVDRVVSATLPSGAVSPLPSTRSAVLPRSVAGSPVASPDPASPAPSGAPHPATSPQPTVSYTTPPMTRTYQAPIHKSGTTLCSASTTGSTDGHTSQQVDWCLLAKARPTPGGVTLVMEVCRDDTLGASLTFQQTRESDLVVRRSDGKQVWRWSAGHPSSQQRHVLATDAGGCWLWTVTWTEVDQKGSNLPHGTYTLTGTTYADEVQGLNHTDATFTI